MANADIETNEQDIAGEDLPWRLAYFYEIRADVRELRGYIYSRYSDLKVEIKDVREEMKELRKEVHKQLYWTIGTMIAIAGIIIAIFKI